MADLHQDLRDKDLGPGILRAVNINQNSRAIPVRYTLEPIEDEGMLIVLSYHPPQETARQKIVERVPLLSTQPNFGGMRWWFACPFTGAGEPCGRRVGKLYLPPGEERFGCRRCHNLTYRSSQESHKHDRIFTLLAASTPGATPETVKRIFNQRRRQSRRRAMKDTRGLLEAFEKAFG